MSDVAIRAEGLSKQFRRGFQRRGSLIEWLRGRKNYEYFWALKDLDFEVKKGEMLGVIGRNGAGKSTLLRILSRITRPTEGYARVPDKIGSLLTVGTGFHPELTGRENIFLNGTLLRMSKSEIRRKFDEIVDFSGVEEFLDTPLKRYSSGMKVRLGFSVAVNLRQELMLVDEVLSVGDAAFREKCLDRMDLLTRGGHTVIFVGHNMEMISSSCDRAIWLETGRIRSEGPATDVVNEYLETATGSFGEGDGFIPLDEIAGHEGEILNLTHVRLLDHDGRQTPDFESGQRVQLAVGYELLDPATTAEVSISATILGKGGSLITSCDSRVTGIEFQGLPARGEFVCRLSKLPLLPGHYRLGLKCKTDGAVANHIPNALRFRVTEGDFYRSGILPAPGSGNALFDHSWALGESDGDR